MSHRDMTRATRPDDRGHKVVQHAIDQGYVASGAEYPLNGFPTHAVANDSRRLIKLAGEHLGVSVAAWVVDNDGNQCYQDCADANAPHGIRFRLFTKRDARRKIAQDSGGSPDNLKYNPWRRAQPRILDDQGRRITGLAC